MTSNCRETIGKKNHLFLSLAIAPGGIKVLK
jgi:hypothetical protein